MGVVRLIGRSISHSASPAMQSAAFAALGLDHTYELVDIPAQRVGGAVRLLRSRAFIGANVTVPYKRDVIRHLNRIDDVASNAGAVNTITRDGGHLLGWNTDVPAIHDEIVALVAAPRRVLILGTGGAAHAVAVAATDAGAAVTLASRTMWPDLGALLAESDIVINATPVGTAADESPVAADLLHDDLAVLDLVYRPSPTRLVREARERGLKARSGAGVLLGQGWRSVEKWLAISVSADVKSAMADALRRELGEGADV